ncbi:MAG TPA: lantibiotic dehydratase [Longimicrobium sp.]|nr:lantibiotic dehydratase [Longimicrobium sp.]
MEIALMKYLTRMASRCTPFGLFAGCSVGAVTGETALRLPGTHEYRRHTRLDVDYRALLVESLRRDPGIRRRLRYQPNTSVHALGERVHYIETHMSGRQRAHRLVAVEHSDALRETLERSREGATIHDLAHPLVDDEITAEEAREFVHELVDSQLLVPELDIPVTGPEPIHWIIDRLHQATGAEAVTQALDAVRTSLDSLDRGGVGAEPDRYRAVADLLRGLPAPVELSRLFQVDLAKPAQARLRTEVVAEIGRAVEWLARLHAPRPDLLARFRERFTERYDQREVPLVEVLDAEVGIGFDFEREPPASELTAHRGMALWERLLATRLEGSLEMVLDEQALQALSTSARAELPDSFSLLVTIGAASESALAEGDFQVCLSSGVGGPTGATMFGRFCHMDAELAACVREHLRAEEALHPEAVFAEVVHLPMGRLGNVLCRPVLREYEIPFLGTSGAPRENQIPITDLWVSVQGDRVVLRSARLGREVVPRMTTAHNFSMPTNLPLYQFLCTLQLQGKALPGWDWGVLEAAPFLPRVRYGRIIFTPARWTVTRRHLALLDAPDAVSRFRAAQRLRGELGLPRRVLLADGDNRLLIDLDDAMSVEVLADMVKQREGVVLTEMLPGPDQLWATGPEGAFTHELVVPFVRARPPSPPANRGRTVVAARERSRPPGSEWLYAKLYTGRGVADRVLREVVAPVASRAVSSGAAEQWFFIRYGDPEPHIRLRLRGNPGRLLSEVLPALQAATDPDFETRHIWRVQLDTYEREIERYGGVVGTALAEQLFHWDSVCVVDLLDAYPGDAGGESRRLLAMAGIDALLADFGFDTERRLELLARYAPPAHLRRQWGSRYREERSVIEKLVHPGDGFPAPLEAGRHLLRRRSGHVRGVVEELRHAEFRGELSVPLDELVFSHTHMFVNRLLRENQPQQERLFYDYLARAYRSALARSQPPEGC